MSVFAGMFRRLPAGAPLSDADVRALKALVSRSDPAVVSDVRNDDIYLAAIEPDSHGGSRFVTDSDGSMSVFAGDPVVSADTRDSEATCGGLMALHQSWSRSDWGTARAARGVFCAAHFDSDRRCLTLITDKLGVRNLYYHAAGDLVVFSTALRVLEGFARVPKRVDVRAVTELTCFGYPLGDRTPYYDVRLLHAGEAVQLSANAERRIRYWRWDDLGISDATEAAQVAEVYDHFTEAIRIRLRDDGTTLAFLSGGLDSRCVVAVLRSSHVNVHTFNYAEPGSQDQAFAAAFARRSGSLHTETPLLTLRDPELLQNVAASWPAMDSLLDPAAERPRLVWSGDGGSVGLGHVYLTREIMNLCRQNRYDAAIAKYIHDQHASVRTSVLRRELRQSIAEVPAEGVREELNAIHCEDAARGFHIFLMVNDQRRHLSYFFEDADLYGFEYHLPFFDGPLLSTIMRIPVDRCLKHEFYNKWLLAFPEDVSSIPWQAYPGHAPCPVPVPSELQYQWAVDARALRDDCSADVSAMIAARNFPGALLSKPHLRLALLIHRRGWRRVDHLFSAAAAYHRYWSVAGGEYVLP
jgi:asparagine synthase (glutamine-hydrolysing)